MERRGLDLVKVLHSRPHYDSIEAFYDELPDVDRRLSGEIDYGVHWGWPWEHVYLKHRVSLVERTGELYVVQLNRQHFRHPHGPVLEVLAVFDDRDECEWALEGWAEHCNASGLSWLVRRLECCVPKYICTACVRRRESAGVVNDPNEACPRCGRKAWGLDPMHEVERRRRPAKEALTRWTP
jgi:hypothetical protein